MMQGIVGTEQGGRAAATPRTVHPRLSTMLHLGGFDETNDELNR